MEHKKSDNTWEKPELFIITNAELNESVLTASPGDESGGDGGDDTPPWLR